MIQNKSDRSKNHDLWLSNVLALSSIVGARVGVALRRKAMNLLAKFQHCSSQGSYEQTDKRLVWKRLRLTVIYYTTIIKRAILKE